MYIFFTNAIIDTWKLWGRYTYVSNLVRNHIWCINVEQCIYTRIVDSVSKYYKDQNDSFHSKVTCFLHHKAEQLLTWHSTKLIRLFPKFEWTEKQIFITLTKLHIIYMRQLLKSKYKNVHASCPTNMIFSHGISYHNWPCDS